MVHPRHDQRGLGQIGLSRCRQQATGSAAVATSVVPGSGRTQATSVAAKENQVIMTVGGGAWEAAQNVAYFQPFFKEETGIEIVRADRSRMVIGMSAGSHQASAAD